METNLVSIILPVYNEEKYIGGFLSSLLKQSYLDFEIIVVDDGSTDKTSDIIKKFQKKDKRIKLIKGEHKGPGFSRNLGAKKAKGNILVFVDADMTFDKDYLKNLIAPILKDKTGNIVGTTHDYETANNLNNIWSKCWGVVRVKEEEGYGSSVIFRAIRKTEFIRMGGFDPSYGYADDQTFWFKYKVKPYVAPNTTCYHRNPETLREIYQQSRWIGASINKEIFNIFFIRELIFFSFILVSPLAIILLAIRKSYKIKDFSLLIPWMFLFVAVRFMGTLSGIIRKTYTKKNFR